MHTVTLLSAPNQAWTGALLRREPPRQKASVLIGVPSHLRYLATSATWPLAELCTVACQQCIGQCKLAKYRPRMAC